MIATAVPLAPILAAAGVDTTATGRLWLDARVEGLLEAPVISADFRLQGATIQGVAIGRLDGDLRYAGQRFEIRAESLLEPARAFESRPRSRSTSRSASRPGGISWRRDRSARRWSRTASPSLRSSRG